MYFVKGTQIKYFKSVNASISWNCHCYDDWESKLCSVVCFVELSQFKVKSNILRGLYCKDIIFMEFKEVMFFIPLYNLLIIFKIYLGN